MGYNAFMINSFLTSFASKLGMTILVTSTLVTTGVAVTKVAGNFTDSQIPKQGVEIQQEVAEAVPTEVAVTSTPAQVFRQVQPTKAPVIAVAFPTAAVALKTTPTPGTSSGLCLVSISGQQYDVTKLASTHSGGNIFKCGTDMTSSYNSKHGTNMSRMSQYIYNGSAVSNTGTPSTGGTNIGTNEDHDDDSGQDEREDREHEDRYVKEDHETEREDN